MSHDLFIATTPPWDHPDAWGQKRHWVDEHLPVIKKKNGVNSSKRFIDRRYFN